MGTRVCEYCYRYLASSSDLVAHYRSHDHIEEED